MDFVTMMLMDKGYYDYDYSEVEKKVKVKSYDESVKSDAEVRSKLAMFGWGIQEERKPMSAEKLQSNEMSAEELQQEVMKDINSRKAQNK